MKAFDFVVVGAGISGFTAAKLLREKFPSSSIALFDGKDTSPKHKGSCWTAPYLTGLRFAKHEAFVPGHRSDYDRLGQLCPALSWDLVAPVYDRRLISRSFPSVAECRGAIGGRFELSCGAAGLPVADLQAGMQDGYAPLEAFADRDMRSMLQQANVEVYDNTEVSHMEITACTASGVTTTRDETYSAQQAVILCGGGFGTPQLLLRSGVGPVSLLESNCKVECPVGNRLLIQPEVELDFSTGLENKSFSLQNSARMLRALGEYRRDGTGPLASYAEWEAYVRSDDQLSVPDIRLTLINGSRGGRLSWRNGLSVKVTLTHCELPDTGVIFRDGICSCPALSLPTSVLKKFDEAGRWATLLLDERSSLRCAHTNGQHAFSGSGTSAATWAELTTKDSFSWFEDSMVIGEAIFGGSGIGSVTDSSLLVCGLRNVFVGDISAIPISVASNQHTIGQATAAAAVASIS